MNFVKGAAIGMIAGTIVGAMNSGNFKSMINKSKRQMKHFQKKFGM